MQAHLSPWRRRPRRPVASSVLGAAPSGGGERDGRAGRAEGPPSISAGRRGARGRPPAQGRPRDAQAARPSATRPESRPEVDGRPATAAAAAGESRRRPLTVHETFSRRPLWLEEGTLEISLRGKGGVMWGRWIHQGEDYMEKSFFVLHIHYY